jgi:hypothetical protein
MDSQFNSLVQGYSSNYVQYKVTGNSSYQNGYMAAQQGLDSIIGQLQDEINSEKQKISDFYKSGIEQKITDLNLKNRKLQRGILTEKDDIVAANIRGEQPAPPPTAPPISTSQYVALGLLGVTTVVLMVL